ncbi:bifunctional methylenetetrahydrofolate dehydrogenase/methenyltetrahydrofolate cyclohydrolase FolD [Maricaulis sp.]|uniref:bifunctional methylenetetrahydrofolate dehydrogenase/methenyltetrahydrofolate cyclohydrolase FolD n=1 Tax=Maricaulis sp. TaxID=1486257 RepID=UPI00261074BF|nr:bifunctional methylenetetrahydrofolate dehydrogenase/methenyltetrahydrofolate cyclohydrolase FolD [Maricaulis sp.]
MSAEIIDGKAVAAEIDARAGEAGAQLAKALGRAPCLAVVLIGEDPASQVYVRNKVRRTEAAGLTSIEIRKPAGVSQDEVIDIVRTLNANPDVDGILVQLPLPDHIDANAVIETIDPDKDVDGLTEASAGRLVLGKPGLRPCTPTGCVDLAKRTLGDLSGKSVVVIGRSILVGKPAALLFLEQNATVTIAHSRTADLPGLARSADILVPAVGRPEMVRGDWVKPGACVLDVGINRIDAPERGEGKTRLVGDAAFDEIVGHAGWITPVPGGIGPMTIAMLLRNTVLAAALRNGLKIPTGL